LIERRISSWSKVPGDVALVAIDRGSAHRHRQVVFEPDLVIRESSTYARAGGSS
jgi:hypothetical protein